MPPKTLNDRGRRLKVAAVLATAALTVGPTGPATAQEAKPTPTSCAGMAFTDPAGDSAGVATRDNLDVTAGFFRYVTDSSGANVLTANIQVTDLHKTVEAGSYYVSWTLRWTSGGTGQYVRLDLFSDGGLTARYGTYTERWLEDAAGISETTLGETKGRLFPGRDGIAEIVVPVAALGLGGRQLTNPYAITGFTNSDMIFHTYPPVVVDSAPDSRSGGKAFEVLPCAEAQTPTAPQPVTPPGQPAGTSQPTPQPVTPPGQPAGTSQPQLNLKVIVGKLSARKITRRRTLWIRLLARERTTALQLRLKRGKKTVATGRIASIRGKRAVKLRLSGNKRTLEAGTYTLQLTGRNASGRAASGLVRVRIGR